MKDYSKEIEDIIPTSTDLASPTIIRGFLKQLESIIRKDVEAEEVRLEGDLKKTFDRCNEYFSEIERLKEENENLKDLNNQLQLQAKEATGKPDSERLHDYMVAIIGGMFADPNIDDVKPSGIASIAQKMLEAWKEATK